MQALRMTGCSMALMVMVGAATADDHLVADALATAGSGPDAQRTVVVTGDSAAIARILPLLMSTGRVLHVEEVDGAYALSLIEPATRSAFTVSVRDREGKVLVAATLRAFERVADKVLPLRARGGHRASAIFDNMPGPASAAPLPAHLSGSQVADPGSGC